MIRNCSRALALALCISFATVGTALTVNHPKAPDSIHAEIQQVYSFHPHELDKEQITQKSAVLDTFWDKAKSQPSKYIPALRKELADFTNSGYFLYDGSKLLLSLSDTSEDRKLVLAAIAKSDLRDLQSLDYFLTVHHYAVLGEDCSAAAFHVLESPDFQVFIAQHVLTLGQNYSLIYMLLPMDPHLWLDTAISRLKSEQQLASQKSLLLLLWYAQTDATDAAIVTFSNDNSRPAEARSYAAELIQRKSSVGVLAKVAAKLKNEDSLRQERRELMKRVSDEALYELGSKTEQLIAKRASR
jgi:hypothetical protein